MTDPTIEAEAAAWVIRLHSDQVTQKDEAGLHVWLQESETHAVAYAAHELLWNSVGLLSGNKEAHEILRHRPSKPAISPRSWSRRTLLGGLPAAAVAVGIAVWRGSSLFKPGDVFETALGEQRRMTLADGSDVLLNTNSRLRVDLVETERRIFLDQGQAFFEVAKDPERPFRVFVGADEVRALGTAFDVRKDGDMARVTLEEGVVAVFRAGLTDDVLQPDVILEPGQQVELATARVPSVSRIDIRRTEAWRYGRIILDGVSLGEAVADLNRYGGKKIRIADPALNRIKVSGVFHTSQPESFVEAVEAAFPIQVARKKNEIVISALK